MKQVYIIPWRTDADRTAIRKWVGRTRGIGILKTDHMWIDHNVWTNVYHISVNTTKAVMLLKLQFPKAFTKDEARHS